MDGTDDPRVAQLAGQYGADPSVIAQVLASSPNARITSGRRDAVRNAAVKGVPGSPHLTGEAVDFVSGDPAQMEAQAKSFNAPGYREIYEPAGPHSTAPHLHMEKLGAQPKPPEPPPNLIQGANPEYGLAGMTREQLLANMQAIESGPEAKRAGELAGKESEAYVEAAETRKSLLPEFKKIQQARIDNFKNRPNTPQYDQLKAEQLPEIRDPARALTQFLPMLALISGAFNKKYALSAIQGITAAANAQKEGDYARRQMAHDSYMDDLKRTIDNNSIKANQYQALINNVNLTDNEFKAQAEALSSQWGESEQLAADYGKGREAMQHRVDMLVKTMAPIARVVEAVDNHKGDQIFRGTENGETYIYDKNNRTLINSSTGEPVVGKWPKLAPIAQRPLTALQDAYQTWLQEGERDGRPKTAIERSQFLSEQAAQTSSDRAWATGKQGQMLQSFNTSISHLAVLDDAIAALTNDNIFAFNLASQVLRTQFGDPKVVDFKTTKLLVSDEVNKAILGGAGAVSDREALQKNFNSASSPEALAGVVLQLKKLMAGQVRSSQLSYLQTTHRSNEAFLSRLLPETVKTMQAVGDDPTVEPKGYDPSKPAPAPPTDKGPPKAPPFEPFKGVHPWQALTDILTFPPPPKAPPPEKFKGLTPGQGVKDKQGNIWKMGPNGPELVKVPEPVR